MSDLKVCRICLRTEAKMFHFNLYQLKLYYEEVIGLQVNMEDGLPQQFCYECASILHKFHKFKEKCYYGQKVLRDLLWRGNISYESIYKIDRSTVLLPLLTTITNNDRVKTYITKDSREDNPENNVVNKIENIELEYLSETSITDREDNELNMFLNDDKLLEQVEITLDERKLKTDGEQNPNDEDIKVFESITPSAVYVEAEKGVLDVKCEEIKEKRKPGRQKRSSGGLLDSQYWNIHELSEEEALNSFRARAQLDKYVNAAFKCKDCFKGFSKQDMLKRHVQLKHAESLGSYECRFCKYRLKLKAFLRRHMKQHYYRYQCKRCPLTFHVENSAVFHDEYHRGVTRKCSYCDEEFRHSSTYYSHVRRHRSSHVCAACGAGFVSRAGLRMHRASTHVALHDHECDDDDDDSSVNTFCSRCNIMFDNSRAYREHLFHSALHSEANGDLSDPQEKNKKILGKKEQAKITSQLEKRSIEADVVIKRERRKRQKHERIKPTTCHQCGEQFPTQAACMKHHVLAHPRTSFYPPHARYVCEICGASLAPGSVANHQNMHSRERLHTCQYCGRQFHSPMGLKRHHLTHTGEKPFACFVCDKRFTQSNSMKLHYRTAHLKEPYPKRVRRKMKEDPKPEAAHSTESHSEESQHSTHDNNTIRHDIVHNQHTTDDNMHYLTLT